MKKTYCQICHKEIGFICLSNGKWIPVNPQLKRIVIGEGKGHIITDDGRRLTGRFVGSESPANASGYISHFTTCRKCS